MWAADLNKSRKQSVAPLLRKLPPFPAVAARLMRLVVDVNTPFREITNLLQADAALAAEVLRLANSAIFGWRYAIHDVPHAAAVLGLDRIRGLVMTLVLREFLTQNHLTAVLRRCWHHNFACALISETFAPAFWIDKGLAYTAGLLHDIGLLSLVASYPDQYQHLLEQSFDSPREFCAQEKAIFGVDHCEAGAWILEQWQLPMEFREVAAHHHRSEDNAPDLIALVHLSCELSTAVGFPIYGAPQPWNPEQVFSQLSDQVLKRVRTHLEELPMTIATRINAFDCEFLT